MKVQIVVLAAMAALAAFPRTSVAACESPEKHDRYQPSGMPMQLWLDTSGKPLKFAAYAEAAKAAISGCRWAIPGETPEQRARNVAFVAPKEWPRAAQCPAAKTEGVLLVHGLTDSPFLMRDLGDFLSGLPGRCFLVRSILLPGHAGSPGDLTIVSYKDWIAAARYGIESFAGEARGVHIAGFSTGGALGVYWANNPAGGTLSVPIRSLMLFSPAIRPTGWFVRLDVVPDVAAWLVEKTRVKEWSDLHADRDFAKYESFPLNAGYQIYLLDEEIERHAGRPTGVPIFVAQSRDDATVNAKDSIDLFLKSTHPSSRMMLVAKSRGDASVARAAGDSRVRVVDAELPERKVIDFAHTSFVASPNNEHYGEKGDYAECLAYAKSPGDLEKYCQCITEKMQVKACAGTKTGPYVWGERDAESVRSRILRRLTFNPRFEEMKAMLVEFIGNAGAD